MSNNDSNKCDICGKDPIISMSDGKGGITAKYCQTCFNKMMAERIGIDAPENVPEELVTVDIENNVHRFKIEYMIWGHIQILKAYEDFSPGYKCEVGAEFDIEFPELWEMMIAKLDRKMNMVYFDDDGRWNYNKIIGDIVWDRERETGDMNIIINGKPYTWDELYREVKTYEGWQIKIEFADPTENLE